MIVFAAIGTGVFVQSHGSSSSTSKNSGGTNSLLPGGGSSILPGSSNNSNTSAGNTADSQTLNLQITYSSDQITVTSLQQADKFSDDSLTSYSQKPNFVRMNFKEQQQAKQSSYFSYSSAFRLVLPDNTSVAPESSREFSGPQQSVSRSNWIDFPTSARVDLTQLTLQLGTGEEAQMTIPLKDGADLSKYQTKTVQLNKTVTYADAQWTLQNATQSYSFNGKQAAKGKVYLTVQMVANNSTDNELFLSSFVRLKSGTDVSSPEYSSDANNFDIIKPRTTNIQGSETFLTPPNTQYTLDFLSNSTISEQTVDFQMQ